MTFRVSPDDSGLPLPGTIPASSLDQFNYALTGICDQMMHLVVTFAGIPDEGRLREAFRISLRQAPVLGYRFCEAEPPFWEPVRDPDPEAWIRIHATDDPDLKIRQVLTEPLDSAAGPQVRLDLIRSGSGPATLCISMHHAVSDAYGLLVYSGLLAGLYRQVPGAAGRSGQYPAVLGDGAGMPVPQQRSLFRYLSRFPPSELQEAAARARPAADIWSFPFRSLDCGNRDFAFLSLAPQVLDAVRVWGRARSATVNDVLLSAVFLALLETAEPAPGKMVPVLHSVDLRRHVPQTTGPGAGPGRMPQDRPDCDICNFSVAFDVILPSGVERTLDAVLPLVHESMRNHKETNSALASALETEALAGKGFPAFREHVASMKEDAIRDGGNCPFFSNIGVLPESALDFGPENPVTRAFVAGMVEFPPGVVLAASTFSGSLTFAMGYCADAVERECATGFLAAVARHLPTGSGGNSG